VRRRIPTATTMPHLGGSDNAGLVAEVGARVHRWKGGATGLGNPALTCGHRAHCLRGNEPLCAEFRIIGEHTDGGFTEYISLPASTLHRIPESLPFERAAALPVSYQTAWRAIHSRAALRPGEDVLVLGASGGTAIA